MVSCASSPETRRFLIVFVGVREEEEMIHSDFRKRPMYESDWAAVKIGLTLCTPKES